ncbi:protein fem-1 homolog CG6966-like isoform X1 [Ptiloglossa arizonensis]|uniref:protein fem-1 homolog CG6966-like isoform X1 n=1 Tax=Ptiloglossa arizonensis TaxID=3350558 RepID=UPI003F9F46E2
MDTIAYTGNTNDSKSINQQKIVGVNARDEEGNTLLHLSAMSLYRHPHIALGLLEAGTHIDIVNNKSKTFEMFHDKHYYYMVNPLKYTTLACLAARVVKKTHRMEAVPKFLRDFVEMH